MDRRTFVVAMPALLAMGCASTQHNDQPASSGPRFSDEERKFITEHYDRERSRAPARAKPAQGVRPGDKLVSGSRPYHLPNAIKDRLSALPSPYTRLVLGADVILVNRDTHDILDVIAQVAY